MPELATGYFPLAQVNQRVIYSHWHERQLLRLIGRERISGGKECEEGLSLKKNIAKGTTDPRVEFILPK